MTKPALKQSIKESPLICSADSVRGILDGRKSQTRRVIKPHFGVCPACWNLSVPHNYEQLHDADGALNAAAAIFGEQPYLRVPACDHNDVSGGRVRARFEKGQRLWVREVFGEDHGYDGDADSVVYKTDYQVRSHYDRKFCEEDEPYYDNCWAVDKWCSPIYMPRWASRITLAIIDVRIERLQDIDIFGIEAEGIRTKTDADCNRNIFIASWNVLNRKRGFSWESNPFVEAVTFKRLAQ